MNFFLIFFLTGFFTRGADKMPNCVRPQDFSMGKFVSSYEACLVRQEKFCTGHRLVKECVTLPEKPSHPYYKTTVDDIDPTKRCKIAKDLTYRCLQDPVRFMGPTNNQGTPITTPVAGTIQSGSGPSSSDVPFETPAPNGNSGSPAAAGTPTDQPAAGPVPLLHPPKK